MIELKNKRLLILGGSRISCEIIHAAKEMGIYTIVADWYPIESSPAKQEADAAFVVNTTDMKEMTRLVKEQKVDGITTGFTDSVLPYYADICKLTGLPSYGTREQFEILTNKKKYKKLCQKFDIPIIKEYTLNKNFTEEDTKNIQYPVIVKPSDSSGARGVNICYNVQDLISAYKTAYDISKKHEVLIERYITTGEECTSFWLLCDGEIYLTAYGNRHVQQNQEGVIPLPVGYTFPTIYLPEYEKNIVPKIKKMFHFLGMKNGMVFMQNLIENGTSYVYDIGFRQTASLEYKLLEKICGYNPMKMQIYFALTGKMDMYNVHNKINPYFSTYAYNVSILSKPGTINQISGINQVLECKDVIDVVPAYIEGETIPKEAKGQLRQITLRILGTATTKEDLKFKMDQIYNYISIIDKSGNSLKLTGLNSKDIDKLVL